MERLILCTLVLGLCLGRSGALAAQGSKDSYVDEHHRNRCRLAHQVLTLGQPANRREWAMETAPTCGASGGEALAALLEQHRGDSDDSPALETVVLLASRLTDASIFQAALRVGSDGTAGTVARAAAWRTTLYQLVPGSYARPEAREDGEEVVESGTVSTAAPMTGAPLPANQLALARRALEDALTVGSASQALNEVMRRVLEAVVLEERIERVCGPNASLWDKACEQALEQDETGR